MNDLQDQFLQQREPDLSWLCISLLKGVLYRQGNDQHWDDLLKLQARVRDFFSVIGLDLLIDEAEGYAFVRSRPDSEADDDAPATPRLVARRGLSFPVSLLLALLRKKLAEFDAGAGQGGGTTLVLSRDEIVELISVFLPESSNEARVLDQVDTHINRVTDLGFLRRMKGSSGPANFEVRRILKAYVDAQWLTEFDQRLAAYQTELTDVSTEDGEA